MAKRAQEPKRHTKHNVTHEGGDRKVMTPDEIREAEKKAAE